MVSVRRSGRRLSAFLLFTGETIVGWNRINNDGNIYDMEYVADNNYYKHR